MANDLKLIIEKFHYLFLFLLFLILVISKLNAHKYFHSFRITFAETISHKIELNFHWRKGHFGEMTVQYYTVTVICNY